MTTSTTKTKRTDTRSQQLEVVVLSQFPESIEDPRDHARPEVHNDIFSDDVGEITEFTAR